MNQTDYWIIIQKLMNTVFEYSVIINFKHHSVTKISTPSNIIIQIACKLFISVAPFCYQDHFLSTVLWCQQSGIHVSWLNHNGMCACAWIASSVYACMEVWLWVCACPRVRVEFKCVPVNTEFAWLLDESSKAQRRTTHSFLENMSEKRKNP